MQCDPPSIFLCSSGFKGKPYKVVDITAESLNTTLKEAEDAIAPKVEPDSLQPSDGRQSPKSGKRSRSPSPRKLAATVLRTQQLAAKSSVQLRPQRSPSPSLKTLSPRAAGAHLESSSATSFYTNMRMEMDSAAALVAAVSRLAKLPDSKAVQSQQGDFKFANLFIPPLQPPEPKDLVSTPPEDGSASPSPVTSPSPDRKSRSRTSSRSKSRQSREDSGSPAQSPRQQRKSKTPGLKEEVWTGSARGRGHHIVRENFDSALPTCSVNPVSRVVVTLCCSYRVGMQCAHCSCAVLIGQA